MGLRAESGSQARRAWERELRKVRVEGGTEEERRTFYTSLYRTRLAPIVFQDVDRRYRGADGQCTSLRDTESTPSIPSGTPSGRSTPSSPSSIPTGWTTSSTPCSPSTTSIGLLPGLVPGGERDQHHDGKPRDSCHRRRLPEGIPRIRRRKGPAGHGEERSGQTSGGMRVLQGLSDTSPPSSKWSPSPRRSSSPSTTGPSLPWPWTSGEEDVYEHFIVRVLMVEARLRSRDPIHAG